MNLDGTIDNRGGNNLTTNGGTIKVFYAEGSDVTFTKYYGRYYPSQFSNTKPNAPSGPSATRISDNQIDLGWADNSNIEDGYRIYRSVDGGGYSELKTVAANSTSTSDNTTSANHKYQYKIVAYNGTAESDPIYTAVVYTTPAAPSGCAISIGTINVTWNDNSAYEDGFKIERELDGGGWNLVHTTGANEESWADTSQPTDANEKYQYRVRAYRGALHSAYSTSGAFYLLPPFEEAIALKDVSSVPLGPDIVFEEALALKNVSGVPACPDIILGEALALKESLTEISRALLLTEAIALKESLPLIHRELPPLEEAIAFIESLPVIHRELPPLEETLALAESFVASEQTIVRKVAMAEFLAEQAKKSNQPVKRIWLYVNSTFYDITNRFMSMGALDREMTYKPGETNRLTISDQVLVMTNNDKYFSDLYSGSPFHDRDYAGSDVIKVYAGFILPTTGYAEVLQKADMTLLYIELETGTAIARLGCEDSFRKVFDIYVGMPDSEGAPNPLTYTAKTFKFIMDDLLQTHAGIVTGKCDIEDVSLTFSSISFEKKTIRECIQKLSEVARGSTVVLGNGTVQFRRFISEVTDVDYVLRSGENYSLLRYRGQDFHWKINKVVVIGAAGVYAEAEITGETGRTLKIENDAILTDAVAADVASECLGRFAVKPALVELTSEYLPSLEIKNVVHVYEPNSLMDPATMQIRRLALDIVNFKSQMTLSIPDSAGRSKVWSEKEDWDEGTLDKLYCPIDLGQLEIAYDELSGTAIFVHDAGVGKSVNWICFNYTKKNNKIIWRDDFRADSRSKYSIHNFPGWHDGEDPAQPGYDSQNHRLTINTGGDKGTTLEIPGVLIQNVIASMDVYITGYYPSNAAIGQWLRFVDSNNQTIALHNAGDTAQFDSCLRVRLNAVWQDEFAFGAMFAKQAWRTLVFEVNGNSWKGYTDEYTMSGSDSTFPNANKVLMGCWQTQGYIRQVMVEHYTLPDPVNNSVSFQFATSDNGTDWSAWTDNITNCADSRYIKVKVSMSRTNFLSSAMPVLENMTVGYFLKGS